MRAIIKLAGVALGATLAGVAMGAPTVTFPPQSQPNYFSGTNARAQYGVNTAGFNDCWIDEFELWVGGYRIVAKSRPRPTIPPAIRRDTEAAVVMFDSNFFPNGSSIEVKCRAKVNGSWYESSYTAPARNRAICFGMNDIDNVGITVPGEPPVPAQQSARSANDWLTAANWDTEKRTDLWNVAAFESEIGQNRNVVFYSGHGWYAAASGSMPEIMNIYDGTQQPPVLDGTLGGNPIYPAWWMYTPDVFTMRESQVGPGTPGLLPPFSDGAIPINLAFLLCCKVGKTNAFETFLYPYYDGYGNYLQNKAVLGFVSGVLIKHFGWITNIIFEHLADGYSIFEAREKWINYANTGDNPDNWLYMYEDNDDEVIYERASVPIYGDEFTNIKGVYSTTGRIISWFKVIS